MATTYRQIIERCEEALETKYHPGRRCQARPYFEAERKLVEEHGFEPALVQAAEFAEHLNQTGRKAHLIGSGCSSVATYLLGLSEVDPIRYRTHISRFWLTSDGRPPVFQFTVVPVDGDEPVTTPEGITAHPMTGLEQVPALLERILPPVDINRADRATFDAINSGDTDSLFQLDAEPIRNLITRLRPTRIKNLAAITALNVIGCSRPEVVEAFLEQSEAPIRPDERRNAERLPVRASQPIVFQETILTLLRSETGLSWDDSLRYLRTAAKGSMNDAHPLWSQAVEGILARYTTDRGAAQSLLERLATASEWAACRAHHAAHAITSYKAAYYRTHHRAEFVAAVKRVRSSG